MKHFFALLLSVLMVLSLLTACGDIDKISASSSCVMSRSRLSRLIVFPKLMISSS